MKLSKEELKNKLAETIKDDNLTISLLEDIEDSWQGFIKGHRKR